MGLLDQLWDDTVAGPRPDNGLGKLRKHATFTFGSASPKDDRVSYKFMENAILASNTLNQNQGLEVETSRIGEESVDDGVRVTRSIMIVKSQNKDSPPVSPAGSTPPVSPFSGGGREAFRFRRRSGSFAFEKATGVGPRSPPPPYDM